MYSWCKQQFHLRCQIGTWSWTNSTLTLCGALVKCDQKRTGKHKIGRLWHESSESNSTTETSQNVEDGMAR